MHAAANPAAVVDPDVLVVRRPPPTLSREVLNLRLRTVDDVRKFFQMFIKDGETPPMKFVYCAKVDTGLDFKPYDIAVVPRGQQPAEHYVVSPNAVVHVLPGRPSEVTLIDEWLSQSRKFAAITRLKFFRTYLLAKMLRVWRENISRRKYMQARTRLGKRLFLSKETFAKATHEVRKLAFALRLVQATNTTGRIPAVSGAQPTTDVGLMDQALLAGPGYPMRLIFYPEQRPTWGYTRADFSDKQRAHASKVAAVMGRAVEEIQGIVSGVCEQVAARAAVPDFTTYEELEAHIASHSNVPGLLGTIAKRERELEKQQRKREMKRKLIEYDMLQPWIRLIDTILQEELFINVTSTFKTFAKHLDLAQSQPRELRLSLEVCLKFHEDDPIQFEPNENESKALITSFVQETVDKFSRMTRLLDMKELRQHFFLPPSPKALAQVIADHKPFDDVVGKLVKTVARDYLDATEKVKVYEPLRAVLHFLTKEWPETHAQWQTRVNAKIGSEELLTESDIKKYIAKVNRSRQEMTKMQNRHCGILSIFIVPLTTDYANKLDVVLNTDIRNCLLTLASRRVNECQKELETNINLLKHPKPDLRNFCDWLERVNQVEGASQGLLQDCAEVDSLYVIAEDAGFEFPPQQKDKRDRTVGHGKGGELPLRQQLVEHIEAARTHKDQHQETIRHQLGVGVSDLIGVLENLTEDLKFGEYREASHSSSLILSKLQGINNQLQSLQVKQKSFNHWSDLLETKQPHWEAMEAVQKVYEQKYDLWSTIAKWDELRNKWNRTPVAQLDGEQIREQMQSLYQKAHKLHKMEPDSVTDRLFTAVQAEKLNLPVMVELCNHALKQEHWEKIFNGMGKSPPAPDARTLENIRMYGGYQQYDLIAAVSAVATGEDNLVKQINKIQAAWDETQFVLAKNKTAKGEMSILGGLDDVLLMLEDHQVQVQTCLASRYIAGIKPQVEEWEVKLKTVGDVLGEWVTMQNAWCYLEFIFSSDDIKVQLATESKLFAQVDKQFRHLMKNAEDVNNILAVCMEENLFESLQTHNQNLDLIQKKLEEYLETKRVAFPRFYFLSNDELLSILSDVRNPTAVQPHLQKCFDAIKSLEFESTHVITAMKAPDGEVVKFSDHIKATGKVEHWLTDIERMMRKSLYDNTKACLEAYPTTKRTEWYFHWPAQCIGCVDQIVWTDEIENVWQKMSEGDKDALQNYMEFYKAQILDTVGLVKGQLSSAQRCCCGTLIVVDVHARDVVQGLIDSGCSATTDFEWLRQLRYYWMVDPHDLSGKPDCHIKHSAANITYGYEYLGNQPRLVITPLTERAFLTCTGALHMYQGAAPQGPAGTGKTESVKDLGKALARQVVVFNCGDGLTGKFMSRMFAGLAQAGAWACFDEFNRIEIEVLSVVAQQMLEITTAIAQHLEQLDFEGHRIKLNSNFGVFITMNPGYAGRTELPDNLKALFRPICMMIPDYALIAEIMFFSEGFSDAKPLAQKMVRLYSLASQQLSKQDHYDFGMRAVKSILVMAGALKRAEPDNPEDMILIRAMRDSNVPKFLRDDTELFLALVSDLFPSVDIKEVVNDELKAYVQKSLVKEGMQSVDGYIDKILQLFETMVVRHGVMLVGATLTGKTRAALTLADALTMLHEDNVVPPQEVARRFFFPTSIRRLNPKSITMGEMYGDINKMTREWQDGVLSHIVRDLVKVTDGRRTWTCFDGPVDAIWIENMNTVLDDNKLLCLVNGERIKIPDSISIMFEVQDLRHASPATVSRCGMVYMENFYLGGGWGPLAKTFSENLLKQAKADAAAKKSTTPGDDSVTDDGFEKIWKHDRLMELLERIIPKTLEFYRKECHEYITTVDTQLVLNMLTLLKSCVENRKRGTDGDEVETQHTKIKIPHADRANDAQLFEMFFAFSFIWSMGGNLSDRARHKFSDFARQSLATAVPGLNLPADGMVYDYYVHRAGLTWTEWKYKTPKFEFNPATPYFDLLVTTADVVALRHVLGAMFDVGKHVLVNGVTGTGKSSAVGNFLTDVLRTEDASSAYAAFSMCFSAQTTSQNLQETIEAKLVRRRGDKELGPPVNKRMILLVDDCNMPQLEVYGASPPIELIRQMISQGGFYDRKKLFWKDIIDTTVCACCGEPGGGKNELTLRMTSQFLCLCLPALPKHSMQTIFTGILGGYLSKFPADVAGLAAGVVDATIDIYNKIAQEMLPTPEKTHYTFNLRDVSKVVQGILQVEPKWCGTPEQLVKIWAHEASRVFADRLINEKDKEWWWDSIEKAVQAKFEKVKFTKDWSEMLYGSWADKKLTDYKEITDKKLMQELLKDYQAEHNVAKMKDTDLVLFDDAVAHLARLCRILRQPRGNALLVGVGGSGRHSLTELASSVCGMDCRSIVIVRNYGVNEFREDLRQFLLAAGCQNKPLVFLFSDTQIVKSQFLEDINNILNIGEVPGLMGSEEMDKIMQATRDAVRAAKKPETRTAMYQFFVSRCRENLHVIFCMSPVGAEFRDRLRMFPSLVNCMTIDWYLPWPEAALLSVATRQLTGLDVGTKEIKEAVAKVAVTMHVSVKNVSEEMFQSLRRRNYTTPTSYLALLASYQGMFSDQNKVVAANMGRYKSGIDKLDSTNSVIEELKDKIRRMQPVLEKASKDADEQAKQLAIDKKDADEVKTEVAAEEAEAQVLMDEASGIQQQCSAGLQEALPALADAQRALSILSKKDIDEVKQYKTPPDRVELAANAVCVLLKEDQGWASAKKVLGQMNFLQQLMDYDKDAIAPATIKKMKPFIDNKDFQPDVIGEVSAPCKSLCMWAHAMYKYYHVNREIQPLREKLKVAEAKVSAAQADLNVKQERLRGVVAKIGRLEKEAAETAQRKADLEKQITEARAKLERADLLIGGLADEKVRWKEALERLTKQKVNVVGTMLLAAGCVAYVGPFPASYRAKLVHMWTNKCKELHLPVDDGFSLDSITDAYTVREWAIKGLPKDDFSVENATILQRSSRWCLMIDPQGQANNFIRNKEKHNKLRVLKLTDDNYMRSIESAIQVGHPVLIENVGEEIDASLNPVLLKQYVKQGGRCILKLGEKEIDYDPAFRLFITTKMPNPTFSPELQIKVTVLNFTVTRQGLEDQQLSEVVGVERADLQAKSDQCVVDIAEGKAKLKNLEDQILKQLAEATGDILDNIELIDALQKSKATATVVQKDLEDVERTNVEINENREKYRSLATRGSLIYGVIADLANVDPMYQYSLKFFKELFVNTLIKVEKIEGESVESRVLRLIDAVTLTAYNVVCRGLFEKHKLLYSFLLTVAFFRHVGKISDAEWTNFLRGAAGAKPGEGFPPCPSFFRQRQWDEVAALTHVPGFDFLAAAMKDARKWQPWVEREDLYEVKPPHDTAAAMSEWQRMLLLKAFRPEKVMFAVSRIVDDGIGKDYTVSPQFSLKDAFADSNNTAPLIFVLSEGTDPTVLFTTFAAEMGFSEKKYMLSLGQDQGPRASAMIDDGRRDGWWVYLQNCHVYVSWMSALERIVEQARPEHHADFRLWLTSKPSADFPVPVLQSGMKLTREPPRGLKANVKDSAYGLDAEVWEEFTAVAKEGDDEETIAALKAAGPCTKERQWKKLLVSLMCFHAVIQERRKFGPLGFNIAYQWSTPDLEASVKTLRIALTADELSWEAVQYNIGTLNYGGRVTDFLDSVCLKTIMMQYFAPAMLEKGYKFDETGAYHPLEPCRKDDLMAYIDELPQYEQPELFGLHANANITFQAQESNALLSTILELQPRGGGGGGAASSDETVLALSQEMLGRLPKCIDVSHPHPLTFAKAKTGLLESLGTFLSQEIDQFNRLLRVMIRSMQDLCRAIKGEVVMSAVSESMYSSFLYNLVPNNWKKDGYLCLKPLASYASDLLDRLRFMQKWVNDGPPASFWVPGFFFPQGFVTSVFQTHSRKHRVAIDTIKFKFTPLEVPFEDIRNGPESGVYVHGFFLDGCGWDSARQCFREANPGELKPPMPVIHFEPIPITTPDPEGWYECPLYKASTRAGTLSTTGLSTNFLLKMVLNNGDKTKEHWTRRAVAALCMLDD